MKFHGGVAVSPTAGREAGSTCDSFTAAQKYKCKYLTICTGLHVTPQVPDLPGVQHVKANPSKTVIHSAEYKERAQLAGRRVIILGSGETGNDIAYESVKAGAKEVVLCSRGGSVTRGTLLFCACSRGN